VSAPDFGYVGEGSVPSSKLRCPLIDSIQLEVGRVNTDGGVDGQRKLKFFPSLGKDPDELDKPPFPNGARKNFDEDLFPAITRLGAKIPGYGARLLEIRIAGVCAFLYVFRDGLAKLL
jgi:hypothetical protein